MTNTFFHTQLSCTCGALVWDASFPIQRTFVQQGGA